MNHILVLSNEKNDLTELLISQCGATVRMVDDEELPDDFDALCVLCGNAPLLPSARLQSFIERAREEGKPIFCEQLTSLGLTRSRGTVSTDKQRLVYYEKHMKADGILRGDLFSAGSNTCLKYGPLGDFKKPILTYREYVCAHHNIDLSDEEHENGIYALFFLEENTLVSAVKISNFYRARFAPVKKWQALIKAIIEHLAGECVDIEFKVPVCSFKKYEIKKASDTDSAVRLGIDWILKAEILNKGGSEGAYEGFHNSISAYSGTQAKAFNIRTDCTGEIGGALLFDSLITKNEESGRAARELFDFIFIYMQVKTGEHRGMLRWSIAAWETCFQDDAARSVLPLLLASHFGIEVPHFGKICDSLDYMLNSTGKNGIRVAATDIFNYKLDELKKSEPLPCAHFNAYYYAALVLAYRVSGKEEYLKAAELGLKSIMAAYPDTYRETSETEETCRMLLPLAVLYGVTKKREHYEWLCRITDALSKFRHRSGGYAEWDTGYLAACSRNHKGECALLANNGDPVADLLYSNNWLPLGFAYAYLSTGEERFRKLWLSHSSFILSAQIQSDDPTLNGAWARAFDMDAREIYGMPHDAGWGPHCIESGWTVGEILMGLQFMRGIEDGIVTL